MQRLKVQVMIDRPLGHIDRFGNVYPLNYGYVAVGGDGEPQDAYIITNQQEVLTTFIGFVVAMAHRRDDSEKKWLVTDGKTVYTAEAIYQKFAFREQYFDTTITLLS